MEDNSLSAVIERAEREYAESGHKRAKVDNGFFCVEIVKPPRRLKRGPVTSYSSRPGDLENLFRGQRRDKAELFNEYYVYGAINSNDQGSRSSNDRRTLIWSGGSDYSPVASSGITWLAVRGEDSICVVVKNQDVDKARLQGRSLRGEPNKRILRRFMGTIVHEMEDPCSELHQRFDKCIKKRYKKRSLKRSFAAVSVALGSDGVHEESGHEDSIFGDGEQVAINFLREEIKHYPTFTYEETIQTAISAFQCLHLEKLEATDILVEIWMTGKQYSELLERRHIEEHLAVTREKPRASTASGSSKKLKRSEDQCGGTNIVVDEHFQRED